MQLGAVHSQAGGHQPEQHLRPRHQHCAVPVPGQQLGGEALPVWWCQQCGRHSVAAAVSVSQPGWARAAAHCSLCAVVTLSARPSCLTSKNDELGVLWCHLFRLAHAESCCWRALWRCCCRWRSCASSTMTRHLACCPSLCSASFTQSCMAMDAASAAWPDDLLAAQSPVLLADKHAARGARCTWDALGWVQDCAEGWPADRAQACSWGRRVTCLVSGPCRETASYQSLGEAERGAPKAPWSPFGAYTIPALVSFSDLISALASGTRRPRVGASLLPGGAQAWAWSGVHRGWPGA